MEKAACDSSLRTSPIAVYLVPLESRSAPGIDCARSEHESKPGCSMTVPKKPMFIHRTHIRKRNRTWEADRRKAAFGRISWEEMLTWPKFAKKAGLIDSSP